MKTPSQLRGVQISDACIQTRRRRISSPHAWAAAVLLCSGLVCGVTSAKTHPNNCTSDCSHQYNSSMRAESRLHVANVQACGSNQICKATETTRHGQGVRSIQTGRDVCQGQCPRP